jgi:hypothetical protein
MSNDEGNPNDEGQKSERPSFSSFSFVINSAFGIRISSFPKTPLGWPATGHAIYRSEVKDRWRSQLHSRFQKLAA